MKHQGKSHTRDLFKNPTRVMYCNKSKFSEILRISQLKKRTKKAESFRAKKKSLAYRTVSLWIQETSFKILASVMGKLTIHRISMLRATVSTIITKRQLNLKMGSISKLSSRSSLSQSNFKKANKLPLIRIKKEKLLLEDNSSIGISA